MSGTGNGEWLEALRYGADGLLPVVAQDARSGEVLMLAWADREAVARTVAEGRAWFYSRSRRALWRKGETSGNTLAVREVRYDCDADALLYWVEPAGPACHTGEASCFHRTGWAAPGAPRPGGEAAGRGGEAAGGREEGDPAGGAILEELYRLVLSRKANPPEESYVAKLLSRGRDRILQKVGEEAVEVVLAGKNDDEERLVGELADLLFHLTVLLGEREIPWEAVFAELRRRRR